MMSFFRNKKLYIQKRRFKVIKAYVGSACSGNPGPAGIGVYMLKYVSNYERRPIYELSESINQATNNIVEWVALIKALEYLSSQKRFINEEIVIYSDSQLVVGQVNGERKIKDPKLKSLKVKADQLLKNFSNIHIDYIPRDKNWDADRLAKRAVMLYENNSLL